ncbi:GAF and ANTAR domain-containing protein [Streptomyces sp. NP160]|uniref:GAF and ANTAR domain-containing protein n=1 Tax=Streptomyces sp. NP160 TaxID=2586637 RepID=UPI0011187FBD|nr:GAF and ANTAR domain-containing protein [Streptomyces sp. NP160]TNM69189.1 GAF and ANTAR domain-containing protein [Streptomyces sp. NP160]
MGADQGSTGAAEPRTDAGALARQLAELAREMHGDPSSQEVLDRVVQSAVALVPHAEHGTISLVRARRTVVSAAATSDTGRRLDDLQTEVGQGPCLDAAFEHQTTRVDDLGAETERWPRLAARAGEVGAASMLCLQLYVDGDNLGALNLLAGAPAAFDDESEDVGLLLAAHAAVAVASAQKVENLSRGLANRDIIGQAKGILMERHRLSADQAFDLLARYSQHTNRKLHDIAFELAATGDIPQG